MLVFGLVQLFVSQVWRWMIVIGTLFGVSFFFNSAGALKPLNILDFVIFGFTQHYMTMIVVPTLYLILIVDIIPKSIEDGIIFPRSGSRFRFLLNFLMVNFFAAFIFTFICFVIYFLSGWIQGLTFELNWSENSLFYSSESPFLILTLIILLYILTLTSFGTLTLFVSLLSVNASFALGFGVFISLLSYISWMVYNFRPFFKFTPIAQMMFMSQYPNKLTEQIQGFTINWSIRYNIILFVVSTIFSLWYIRKKEF